MPSEAAVDQETIADLEDMFSGLPECSHKGIRVLQISLHARKDPQSRYALHRDMEGRIIGFANCLVISGLLVALKGYLVPKKSHQEILTAAYLRVLEGTRDQLRSSEFLERLAVEIHEIVPMIRIIRTDSQGRFRLEDLIESNLLALAPG